MIEWKVLMARMSTTWRKITASLKTSWVPGKKQSALENHPDCICSKQISNFSYRSSQKKRHSFGVSIKWADIQRCQCWKHFFYILFNFFFFFFCEAVTLKKVFYHYSKKHSARFPLLCISHVDLNKQSPESLLQNVNLSLSLCA